MKKFLIMLISISILFCLACTRKNETETADEVIIENTGESENPYKTITDNSKDKEPKRIVDPEDYINDPDKIIELLYDWNIEEKQRLGEIKYIERINFGIPDGYNWLVTWPESGSQSLNVLIFSISDRVEELKAYLTGIYLPKLSYDLMEKIPGKHIPDTGLSIYDLHGDGKDRLIGYYFDGIINEGYVIIYEYNADKSEYENLINTTCFNYIDKNNGPAPIQFLKYKGKDGLIVSERYSPEIHPPPINLVNNEFAWYFFSYDNSVNKYILMEEYLENDTGKVFSIYDFPLEWFRLHLTNRWQMIIKNIKEIEPEIKGGRSFLITRTHDALGEYEWEQIFDFDQVGNFTQRKIDEVD